MKRRLTETVLAVDVGAMLQERCDTVGVTVSCGPVQRYPRRPVFAVDVGTVF